MGGGFYRRAPYLQIRTVKKQFNVLWGHAGTKKHRIEETFLATAFAERNGLYFHEFYTEVYLEMNSYFEPV